jgi:hypothetical protein
MRNARSFLKNARAVGWDEARVTRGRAEVGAPNAARIFESVDSSSSDLFSAFLLRAQRLHAPQTLRRTAQQAHTLTPQSTTHARSQASALHRRASVCVLLGASPAHPHTDISHPPSSRLHLQRTRFSISTTWCRLQRRFTRSSTSSCICAAPAKRSATPLATTFAICARSSSTPMPRTQPLF